MATMTRPIRKQRERTGTFIRHVLLVVGSLVMLFPILWMISTSFKPPGEVLIWPPLLLPQHPTLANYSRVFATVPIFLYFLNSVIMSAASTVLVVASSLVAGYVFGKFRFPGRDPLFFLLLATAIVPFESYMTPLYLQMVQINWVNTYPGLVAPYVMMSFGVFLMRQHVRAAIPDELIHAARVDGASEWSIFTRVVTPLSTSAMGALGIFAFIQAWAAFLWPLLIANSKELFNMELGLTAFQFRFTVDYGPLMAGSVLNVLPMFVVFVLLGKQIIDSAAMTGLKG